MKVLLFLAFILVSFSIERCWVDYLTPNIIVSAEQPRYMDDSGFRMDFDADQAAVIGNWIRTHQAGWQYTRIGFDPSKPQITADNYGLEVDSDTILLQYYKTSEDLANPSDSFIMIRRPLSADEKSFWQDQIAQISKTAKKRHKLSAAYN